MLANLLSVAGIDHVITIDLHASQMQGFFKCPVDNLHAEPLIARWIRHNVSNWRDAVCVSKNAGGTKRVTSLADALKLNFGMVTTDRRRPGNMSASMILRAFDDPEIEDLELEGSSGGAATDALDAVAPLPLRPQIHTDSTPSLPPPKDSEDEDSNDASQSSRIPANASPRRTVVPSPLRNQVNSLAPPPRLATLLRSQTTPVRSTSIDEENEYTDERAREVIHGRLIHGHIVPDDYPSPSMSAMTNSTILEQLEDDPMSISHASDSYFAPEKSFGGTAEAADESDEEEETFKNPDLEQMITLVGNVRNRPVFIVDDMIDKSGSWIAAAETVVKRGGAKKVYCIATHGLFGGDSLQELQDCDCIDMVVVTNSFPIPPEKAKSATKLCVIDLSNLLSEAIRRNHYGESISALFQHIND